MAASLETTCRRPRRLVGPAAGIPAPHRTHLFIGPPETVPVRADRAEGGVLLVWRLVTLPTVDKVRDRIAEVARSF